MQKTLIASAFALMGLSAAVPAQAMPFPPLTDAQSSVTLVAMGCGPGFTRGPYGHCHPIHAYVAPGPVVVAPGVGVGVVAPGVGVVVGPHPHCWWRNGVRHCN
ncbi:MAG TPA: hypothetical protein VFE63_07070 [Roseiarcus sp.]|jgi:hypothetical protein|nr:hypothetical protein [Roseiarcus sp.]